MRWLFASSSKPSHENFDKVRFGEAIETPRDGPTCSAPPDNASPQPTTSNEAYIIQPNRYDGRKRSQYHPFDLLAVNHLVPCVEAGDVHYKRVPPRSHKLAKDTF